MAILSVDMTEDENEDDSWPNDKLTAPPSRLSREPISRLSAPPKSIQSGEKLGKVGSSVQVDEEEKGDGVVAEENQEDEDERPKKMFNDTEEEEEYDDEY